MMSKKYSQIALGKRIKFYREKYNYTQKELAQTIGNISPQYISDIENGVGSTISYDKLQRLATALHTDMDMLLIDSLVKYETSESTDPLFLKICEEIKCCHDPVLLEYYDHMISAFLEFN